MALLGLFGGKEKGDHPLADPKAAKEALAALASGDPVAVIDEVATWLEPLPTAEGLRLERRLEIILQLDEAAIAHARRVARDYVTATLGRAQEFRLWQTTRHYWHHLALAYADCLRRRAEDPKAGDSIKASLPLLCARYLNALGGLLKWDQYRYGPIEGKLWADAGQAYLAAHETKATERAFRLYTNWPVETCVAHEYLRLLVFHASSMDSLLPMEIELAERLIAHLLPHFVFTDQPRPDNVYWVDMAKSLPPTRLARLPEVAPTLRFFSTGKAIAAIEALQDRIRRDNQVPADLLVGGQYPPETVLSVLDHLAACCAPKPPMRHHDRHKVKSLLAVVHDLGEIHARLAGDAPTQDGETWVAEDVSLGGLGAQMSLAGRDWLKVGVLVGMRPEGGDNWLVGVVRRFSRGVQNTGAVGVETIGKTPRAVSVDCSGLTSPAVLLEASLRVGEEARLVIPPRAWEDFMNLSLTLDGNAVVLQPVGIAEQNESYLIGRYRVVSAG